MGKRELVFDRDSTARSIVPEADHCLRRLDRRIAENDLARSDSPHMKKRIGMGRDGDGIEYDASAIRELHDRGRIGDNAHRIERNAPHIGAGDPAAGPHADTVDRDGLHQRFRKPENFYRTPFRIGAGDIAVMDVPDDRGGFGDRK